MTRPLEDDPPQDPIQALPVAAPAPKRPGGKESLSGMNSIPLSRSDSTSSYRKSNPSAASLYASTLSPPSSRPMSPAGQMSPSRILSDTVFDSATNRTISDGTGDGPGEPLSLLTRSFVPHIAIHASEDAEALISGKGFRRGLWEILRPFGERIQGKVTIRDSHGLTKSYEDFAVRFTRFGENVEHPDAISGLKNAQPAQAQNGDQGSSARERKMLSEVEAVVERHLSYAEDSFVNSPYHAVSPRQGLSVDVTSPYYALYLRRLLSGFAITPHETFAHPVACVIAISSRNETPIEELRRLYMETSQGEKSLPPWVDGDYLRYYVLIHDEENDDIRRSMSLFDQMKRNLGLHCHLLRLRSSQSAETDDDTIPLPASDWMTASEEMAEIRRSESEDDFEDITRYIFESDATAIRTFMREMVMQSVIPTMERHVSVWNDQTASRRRGFAGRFMNLSRKWAGFGVNSRSSGGGSGSGDNYDSSGFYRADAPEAIIRKLADYAFMLRDWKLAQSTYDLLRSDFNDSKAWKYHAAANEMAALSLLLVPQQLSSKSRAETIDQMLESAFYSYGTRCNAPYGAMRSLTLSMELLRLRGGTHIDDAGRWGLRLLESKTLGPVGDALTKERLAICYASKEGIGGWNWGGRHRKAAAWSVLAAEAWARQSKYIPARRCLNEAEAEYSSLPHKKSIQQYAVANEHMVSLRGQLVDELDFGLEGALDPSQGEDQRYVDEESEALTDLRARRTSVALRPGLPEVSPLHSTESEDASMGNVQKDFG